MSDLRAKTIEIHYRGGSKETASVAGFRMTAESLVVVMLDGGTLHIPIGLVQSVHVPTPPALPASPVTETS